MKKQVYDFYDRLIFTHDVVTGLNPNKPYSGYPYNYTGLLHAADNALIYCTEEHELRAAERCREIAIKGINNTGLLDHER